MQAGQGSRPAMFFDASSLCSLMWESIMAGTSGYIVSRVAEYNENQALSHTYYSFFQSIFYIKWLLAQQFKTWHLGGGALIREKSDFFEALVIVWDKGLLHIYWRD